jgi:hypothetical protein
LVTGSYWPGDLYLLRGLAKGSFAPPEILKASDGSNVNAGPPWKSKDKYEADSLAAVPCLIDHDGDGDLDLYIGNIAGRVIHIENKGTAKKYSFDPSTRTPVMAAGSPLKVDGDAGPLAADWDGDGKIDLVVGANDGSVWWFRNLGKKGKPEYAAGVALLPKSKGGYGNPVPFGGAPEGPGNRAKVAVEDWNGDGLKDLLVGDVWYEAAAALKLTDEQVARRDELKKQQKALNEEFSKLYSKLKEEWEKDARAQEIQKLLQPIYQELSKLEPHSTARGSVWLYLRQPTSSTER